MAARMTPPKVYLMREMYRDGKASQVELARLFDCSQQMVSAVVTYRLYKEVGPPNWREQVDAKGRDRKLSASSVLDG